MDNAADMQRAERLARTEAELANALRQITELREDVREIRDALREMHGGWKTIMAMFAVAGAIGSAATLLWSKFFAHAP